MWMNPPCARRCFVGGHHRDASSPHPPQPQQEKHIAVTLLKDI